MGLTDFTREQHLSNYPLVVEINGSHKGATFVHFEVPFNFLSLKTEIDQHQSHTTYHSKYTLHHLAG